MWLARKQGPWRNRAWDVGRLAGAGHRGLFDLGKGPTSTAGTWAGHGGLAAAVECDLDCERAARALVENGVWASAWKQRDCSRGSCRILQ